jgi:hypothetical protein
VLNFKKHSRVIVVEALALAAVLCVGFAVNWAGTDSLDISNRPEYEFPEGNYYDIFFKTDREAYNPDFISIDGQLMNTNREVTYTCGEHFTLVKQAGDEWKVVPLVSDVFYDIAYVLSYGDSYSYQITPEVLSVKLDEGKYRIVTDVSIHTDETNSPKGYTVWAEFHIDKSAVPQETITIPSGWLGNFDGEEMTPEAVKRIAHNYTMSAPSVDPNGLSAWKQLTIDDLSEYKSMNFSSDTNAYNVWYSVENGFNLVARSGAGENGVISRMSVRRISDGATLEISASTYERIDEFLGEVAIPKYEPK